MEIVENKIDQYQFLGILGTGSLGEVIHARDKQTNKEFAIKRITKSYVIEEQLQKNLFNEIKIMYQLSNSEYIIRIFDHFEDLQFVYLILEYAKGVKN